MTPKPVTESPLRRGCSTRRMLRSSREGYRVGLRILLVGVLLTCSAIAAGVARGADYPHNDTNDIGCESCHYLRDGNLPPWSGHVPQNIDDTATNNLCWSCHNDLQAPYVRTHSSLSTGNKYGDWSMPCTVCHDQHKQAQCRMYGSSAYLYSGISSAVSATEITQAGAGWVPNQWAGMTVIGDVLSSHYSYRVQSNTADTLVVKGPVDQTVVQVGDNFAIVYGRLVRSTIKSPTSGDRLTKLFANSGDNSFADGDNTYDGVCEVCHTQTNHFRNDGSGPDQHHMNVGGAGGLNCISCHSHKTGFAHGGGAGGQGCGTASTCHGLRGSHPMHVSGVQLSLVCSDCHNTSSFPLFVDGPEKAGTHVCDTCHSPDGAFDGVDDPVFGAKANWNTGVYSGSDLGAGKEKWCAGCHDQGTSVVNGVSARAVGGDNTTWGFFRSGHGKTGIAGKCTDCHDPNLPHTDGIARSYQVDNSGVVRPYNTSFRLKIGMDIPRPSTSVQEPEPSRYALCFSCHDANKVFGDPLLGDDNPFYRATYATQFRHSALGYGSWGHGGRGSVKTNTVTETTITYSSWKEDTGRGSPGTERAYVVPDIMNPQFIYPVRYPEQWWPWFEQTPIEVVPGSTMKTDNPALWNGGQTSYAFGLPNSHYFHLANIGAWWDWDSDGDGIYGENGHESTRSCPTCHNVHGSTYRAMIRDGRLEGNKGLQLGADGSQGSYITPYGSGTCEGLCHTGWNNGYTPRPIYWYAFTPQTTRLHPSGVNTANSWSTIPANTWATALYGNDGDDTYALHGTGSGTDSFYVNMDDPPSCTSVQNLRISAYVRTTDASGSGVYSGPVNFDLGYKTGTATRWKGSTAVPAGTNYSLIQSSIYTTDSNNGALDCADINSLQLAVWRRSTGVHQDRVTEVYAEVTYTP